MKYITEIVAISIVIVPVFIQITPIKLNPISWLGNALMKGTNCRIDKMDKKIDVNEIENLRRSLLDFSNSCQNGNIHSRERFDQFFQDEVKYHELLERHNLKNGRVDRDVEYVDKLYLRLLEENRFSN